MENYVRSTGDTENVTRVEIIDSNGRQYVNMDTKIDDIQLQDDNRTMKIFLK